jgi:hypothetical protein
MLQTIEVEIDPSGYIHPLEVLSFIPAGRAYLTLLPSPNKIYSDHHRSWKCCKSTGVTCFTALCT